MIDAFKSKTKDNSKLFLPTKVPEIKTIQTNKLLYIFNVHHGITIVTIYIVHIQLFLYIVFSLTRYPSDIHSLFCFHFNVLNNKQNNVLRGT